jgi:hypothetical protein
LRDRWRKVWEVAECYPPVLSIGESAKCGHPKHPLMLAYDTPIVPWNPPTMAFVGNIHQISNNPVPNGETPK